MLGTLTRSFDRSLRALNRSERTRLQYMWLGQKGCVTDSGVLQIVRKRGREAGLGDIHTHQLRPLLRPRLAGPGGARRPI
jgi:hypothetical protein